MQITDVRLRKVNSENRMKAVASVTFDMNSQFMILKLSNHKMDYLLLCLAEKIPNSGEFKDIAHPINAETREKIQKAILEAYEAPETESAEE